jgi:hypothetical protein
MGSIGLCGHWHDANFREGAQTLAGPDGVSLSDVGADRHRAGARSRQALVPDRNNARSLAGGSQISAPPAGRSFEAAKLQIGKRMRRGRRVLPGKAGRRPNRLVGLRLAIACLSAKPWRCRNWMHRHEIHALSPQFRSQNWQYHRNRHIGGKHNPAAV